VRAESSTGGVLVPRPQDGSRSWRERSLRRTIATVPIATVPRSPTAVDALAATQAGVVARAQLLALGLTCAQARAAVDAGRWKRLHPGVYATFTGPAPEPARVWAAVLRAGRGAVAGSRTSLWLCGLLDHLPSPLDVCVPAAREVTRAHGVRTQRRRGLAELTQPASSPPRLRLEVALLDVAADQQRPEAVVDLVLRAVQRRRTTPARLRAALAARRAHRWRRAARRPARRRRRRCALRARAALPARRRALAPPAPRRPQRSRTSTGAPTRYRDVRYPGLVVELDGLEARTRPTGGSETGRATTRWRSWGSARCGTAGTRSSPTRAPYQRRSRARCTAGAGPGSRGPARVRGPVPLSHRIPHASGDGRPQKSTGPAPARSRMAVPSGARLPTTRR
jgi:hypothetical protein